MEHIKQGNNQCFPTVLAMLSGTDVNKILAESQAMSPIVHSWADYLKDEGNADEITNTYRALCRKYAPYLIDYCKPISVNDCIQRKLYMSYAMFTAFIAQNRRGAVLLCSRFRSQPCAHIAAFENSLIYDGNLDGPVTAHEYYKMLATKTVMCPYAVVSEY
jgi:hypothetical protein